MKSNNNQPSQKALKSLLDLGGTTCVMHRNCVPKNCETLQLKKLLKNTTAMETFKTTDHVEIENVILPKFDHNERIESQTALHKGHHLGTRFSPPNWNDAQL